MGVNVVDGKRIKEKVLDEEIFIVDDERVIVNVNTLEDLKIAKLICSTKAKLKFSISYIKDTK